jgi:hypothetical protein
MEENGFMVAGQMKEGLTFTFTWSGSRCDRSCRRFAPRNTRRSRHFHSANGGFTRRSRPSHVHSAYGGL